MRTSTIRKSLFKQIRSLDKSECVLDPSRNFTRNRKLSFEQVISAVLALNSGSLTNDLLDFFHYSESMPSSSAFIQQRSKVLPAAFQSLLYAFNYDMERVCPPPTFKGLRLLAIDGSDIHIPTNAQDHDSSCFTNNGLQTYNMLHLNALYDLLSHTYTDALVQKYRHMNEHRAFTELVDRSSVKHALIIADRGYESFNNMAHIQEKNWFYLIRIKDGFGGIASGSDLPDEEEFDFPLTLALVRRQTTHTKSLLSMRNQYRFVPSSSNFDYLPSKSKKHDPIQFYSLSFRIVRFQITENTYETVVTNLPSDTFPSAVLKQLYAMRWGIETSFRALKYTIGLLHFHSKKTEYILQEIFARLIMYNFTEMIISCVVVKQKKRKYEYKVNFSIAAHVCRKFYLQDISPPKVEMQIICHVVPIRPNRKGKRDKHVNTAVHFTYRVS